MGIEIFFLLCIGVGLLGRKRVLGFLGFFLLSVFLTPVIGLLVLIATSPGRWQDVPPQKA